MFQIQEKCSKCGKTFTPQMVDWYNEPVCPDCAEEYINSVTTNTDGDVTAITTKGKILTIQGEPNKDFHVFQMPDPKEMKVKIWDKELTSVANWDDFLQAVEEKERENRRLEAALTICIEEELKRKGEEINAVNISRRISEIMREVDKEILI